MFRGVNRMPVFAVIQQDQYTATTDLQCITVVIPDGDEYKALLAGMLQFPSDVLNYADPASAQADGVAAAWRDALVDIDWEGCVLPQNEGLQSRWTLWARLGVIVTGNAMAFINLGAVFLNGYYAQTAAAINDKHYHTVWMSPGTYTLSILYRKASNAGIATIKAVMSPSPTISIGTVDMYISTSADNNLAQINFVVTVSGKYLITVEALTKNASSSGYLLPYSIIEIARIL